MKFSVRDVLLFIAQQPLVGMPAKGIDDTSFKNDTLRSHITGSLSSAASFMDALNNYYQIPDGQELAFAFVLDAKFITIAQKIVTIKQGQL